MAGDVELPQVKLADFGVSLLRGEGAARRVVNALRRPAVTQQPMPAPEVATLPPSAGSLNGGATGFASDDDEEDEDTPTSSLMVADATSEPDDKTAALPSAAFATVTGSAAPVVSVNPQRAKLSPQQAISLSSKAADAPTLRRTGEAAVDLLAAAPEPGDAGASHDLTQADMLIGTPMYMAPELWESGSHAAEPAADIFSFGVMAIELLTGSMPFSLPPVLAMGESEQVKIARLGELRPELGGDLGNLIDSCLSMDPSRRPSARELKRRLQELGAVRPGT